MMIQYNGTRFPHIWLRNGYIRDVSVKGSITYRDLEGLERAVVWSFCYLGRPLTGKEWFKLRKFCNISLSVAGGMYGKTKYWAEALEKKDEVPEKQDIDFRYRALVIFGAVNRRCEWERLRELRATRTDKPGEKLVFKYTAAGWKKESNDRPALRLVT